MYLVAIILCSIDFVSDLRRNLEALYWDNSEDGAAMTASSPNRHESQDEQLLISLHFNY